MNATSEEDEWVYSNKPNNRSDDSPNEMTDENVEMINTNVPERRPHSNSAYQTIDEVDAATRTSSMMVCTASLV